jgi:uncharacterized protein (TIGR02246 family)
MKNDEQEIRRLVATWMAATKSGDVEVMLNLMAEDAVFLLPCQSPMIGKSAFAAAVKAQADQGSPGLDGKSDIQEIQVLGEWAFMWTRVSAAGIPSGTSSGRRAGQTLSILRKQNGNWLLASDANMLAAQIIGRCN